MFYSVIVPTFKRPNEVKELLESLTQARYKSFEVILADGTPDKQLEPVIAKYRDRLTIQHLHRPYLGISESRNLGAEHAKGDYFIFFDSDCIIPPTYFDEVNTYVSKYKPDAYGGPDAATASFTPVQKAISYSMTSLLTTGGIRGGKKRVGKFHPRGFNMGISKTVFKESGGYSLLKCAEDIELSIRLIHQGYKVVLIPLAFVYHKRRTTLKQFYRQVFRFGAARINIFRLYRNELKITHVFPVAFLFYILWIPLSAMIHPRLAAGFFGLLLLYIFALFIHSAGQNKSLKVGILSVASAIVQFTAYGFGFLTNFWVLMVMKRKHAIV